MLNSSATTSAIGSRVMKRQVKQTLFILLACASLVLSTFGACICPHHEPKPEKTELSCHSSHKTESVQTDPVDQKLDSQCICVREVSPAIFNKSDRKKSDGQKETAAPVVLLPLNLDHFDVISSPASYPERVSSQSSFHRISAPSRAPPRL